MILCVNYICEKKPINMKKDLKKRPKDAYRKNHFFLSYLRACCHMNNAIVQVPIRVGENYTCGKNYTCEETPIYVKRDLRKRPTPCEWFSLKKLWFKELVRYLKRNLRQRLTHAKPQRVLSCQQRYRGIHTGKNKTYTYGKIDLYM